MTKKIRKRRANYFNNGGFQWDKSLSFGKNMSNAFNSGALNSAISAVGSIAGQGISGGLSTGVGNAMQGLSSIAGAIPGPQGAILGAGLGIAGGLLNRTFGSQINEQAVQEAKAANTQQGNMQFSISNTADLLNQSNFGLLGSLKTSDIGKDGWFSNKAKNLTARLNAQRNTANQQAIANFGIAAENMDAQNDFNALANYAAYGGPLTMRYTGTMSPFGNTFADGGSIKTPIKKKSKLNSTLVSLFGEKDALELTNEYNELKKELQGPSKKGSFGGGSMSGSGVGGRFNTIQDYSSLGTFNEAFDRAYKNKESIFKYGEKYYNTRKENNPIREINNRLIGNTKDRIRLRYKDPYDYRIGPVTHQGLEGVPMVSEDFPLTVSDQHLLKSLNKKAFGGDLLTHGAEWDNGITIIDNGGTHEESPYEGVPMGMDAQGIPNLVEEGEVIFNDYVFSDRMKVPKAVRSKYKLRENKNITFADAAKKIAKESEERPNDPISQRGLDVMLEGLASVQEEERIKKQMRDPKFRQQVMNQLAMQKQQYAQGGLLGRKYSGPGDIPNVIRTPDQTDPYAFYGNNGRNRVTNARIAQGWDNFTDSNGNMLYDPEKGTYSPDYLDIRFQSWLKNNYDNLSKNWWNSTNAPDYFKAGNKSAPTFDQMVGTIFSPGLMYDKKYGEAHDFGRYAYNQYRESLKPAPLTLNEKQIKGLELPKPSQIPVPNSNSDDASRYPTWMRYTPVVAAGVGTLTDALGLTNKPDYSNADTIFDAINSGNYMPVSAASLGDYLTYRPFDINRYINKLNAQSSATRRAIVNQSAGNRATAIAGLLAADSNARDSQGDLAIKAEESNLGQEERRATFNRGTSQFNSEMGLKAAMANQNALASLRDYRLKGTLAAAQMREGVKRLADANRSANLTNFVQGLGDIGSENVGWNQLQWAIEHGVFGPMQDRISKGYRRKNGGKLLTKRG